MIVPDLNLLFYAHSQDSPLHSAARKWWEDLMRREAMIGIPWAVTFGFIRLATHPAVRMEPLTPADALDRVESWFAQPNVQVLEAGPRHLRIVRTLFDATGVGGALTTDTHLAALTIEHQSELHSNDSDFSRFPGLRWKNPIA
jgi:toxin-antitoxin system PIN domain toxin